MGEEQENVRRGVIPEARGIKEGNGNYTQQEKTSIYNNNTSPYHKNIYTRNNSAVNRILPILENFRFDNDFVQNIPSSKKEIAVFLVKKIISQPLNVDYQEMILAVLFNLGSLTREPILNELSGIGKIKSTEDVYKVEILSDTGLRIHGDKIAHELWNKICQLEENSIFNKNYNLDSIWTIFKENFQVKVAALGVREVKIDLYRKIGDGTKRVPPEVIRAVGVIGDKQCLPALVRLYEKEKKESSYISTLIKSVVKNLIRKEKINTDDPMFNSLSEKEVQVIRNLSPRRILRASI